MKWWHSGLARQASPHLSTGVAKTTTAGPITGSICRIRNTQFTAQRDLPLSPCLHSFTGSDAVVVIPTEISRNVTDRNDFILRLKYLQIVWMFRVVQFHLNQTIDNNLFYIFDKLLIKSDRPERLRQVQCQRIKSQLTVNKVTY